MAGVDEYARAPKYERPPDVDGGPSPAFTVPDTPPPPPPSTDSGFYPFVMPKGRQR